MRAACWIARAPAWRSQDKSKRRRPARRGRRPAVERSGTNALGVRRPVSRGSTYRPVGRGPCAPPPGTHFSAGHMGPALQVHTPPQKKNNAAPLAGRRAFRPCIAQTEEGYIRRLVRAGTAGEIPPKGGKGANLLGNDIPLAILRGRAALAENDLARFCVNGINSRNAGIVIPKRAAIDCNRAACSRVILMI